LDSSSRWVVLAVGSLGAVGGTVLLFSLGNATTLSGAFLGVLGMLCSAAFFIAWIVLTAIARNETGGKNALTFGAVIGLVGLVAYLQSGSGTNGSLLSVIALSCGALFFFGGLAILAFAQPHQPTLPPLPVHSDLDRGQFRPPR